MFLFMNRCAIDLLRTRESFSNVGLVCYCYSLSLSLSLSLSIMQLSSPLIVRKNNLILFFFVVIVLCVF